MNGFIVCHGSALLVFHSKGNQRNRLCLSRQFDVDKWVSLNLGSAPKHAVPAVRQVKLGLFPLSLPSTHLRPQTQMPLPQLTLSVVQMSPFDSTAGSYIEALDLVPSVGRKQRRGGKEKRNRN